jgi:hypothetical protein
MANQVDICNLALGLLGAEPIGALSESVPCGTHWETSVKATLQAFDWSFARKRQELSQSSTSPAFGFDYSYPLPADCLQPLIVNRGTGTEWIVEGENILTNEDEIELIYTAYITDEGSFPPLFVDALAARLGADIAPSVTRNFSLQQQLMQLFDLKVGIAMERDANSRFASALYKEDTDNSDWITCR